MTFTDAELTYLSAQRPGRKFRDVRAGGEVAAGMRARTVASTR